MTITRAALAVMVALATPLQAQTSRPIDVTGAAEAWMAAFNAYDAERLASHTAFPHVLLSGAEISTWSTPAEFIADNTPESRAAFAQRTGWHHSTFDEKKVVQETSDKSHLVVNFTRYRADGSVIGRYESLWVFIKVDGAWKLQARSTIR